MVLAQELRSQCAVLDYGKKDFGSSTAYKNSGFLGDISEDTSDAEFDEGVPANEDLDDDEQVLWGEAETEAQEAMATLQMAKNTLKQARLKQNNVCLARQYYKGKGKGSRESGKGSDDSMIRDSLAFVAARLDIVQQVARNLCPRRKWRLKQTRLPLPSASTRSSRPWRLASRRPMRCGKAKR